MTQLVTVQTDFTDLDQMAHGLVGRVHATHVILPAGDAVDEGEWAQFEITLLDGSAGLAGLGRCVTIVDNGDEREPHQRFDVVFDSLQFEVREQRVFEHILAVHGEGGQALEQVVDGDAESLPPAVNEDTGNNYVDVSTEFTGSVAANTVVEAEAEAEAEGYGDEDRLGQGDGHGHGDEDGEPTMVASAEDLENVLSAPSSAPPRAPTPADEGHEMVLQAARNGGYGYASVAAAQVMQPALHEDAFEEPVSGERIAPTRPVNGSLFVYANGIPFPAKPPRPDLDASLRVTPAPRPAGSSSH